MARKFEVTARLAQMRQTSSTGKFGNLLDDSVAMLNLPAAFYCTKGCGNCMMTPSMAALRKEREESLPIDTLLAYIQLFAKKYGTVFITINGRGDPFHPIIADEIMHKISCASELGIQALLFTSGDHVDPELAASLARHRSNLVVSLFGNPFVDADFLADPTVHPAFSEPAARGLYYLMSAYALEPESESTRIAFNYVVSESDLRDPTRLAALKVAIESHGFCLVCNTDFFPEKYHADVWAALGRLAIEYSTLGNPHTTVVDGVCQMGAGSSFTIAANGDIYRCPYLVGNPDGNITVISPEELDGLISKYKLHREFACVFRRTPIPKE